MYAARPTRSVITRRRGQKYEELSVWQINTPITRRGRDFVLRGDKKGMQFILRLFNLPFILYFCNLNTLNIVTKTKYHDTGGVV